MKESVQQMNVDEISPRQIQVVEDIAPPIDGNIEMVNMAAAALQQMKESVQQMNVDEISPRQIQVVEDIAPPIDGNIEMVNMAAAALQQMKESVQQMNADEISPRQIQVVEDTAPLQAEGIEQLKSRLADLDFPNKLFEVLNSPQMNHCIRWNADGTGLQIVSHDAFCKDALNLLCHGKFDSLTRQFQAYGFKKNTKSQCKHEYIHEKGHFLRAKREDLKRISRKQTKGKAPQADQLVRMVEEVTALRERFLSQVDAFLDYVNSFSHAT